MLANGCDADPNYGSSCSSFAFGISYILPPLCVSPCQLEELCGGETLDMAEREELSESQRTHVPARLSAAHLLLSAMEGEDDAGQKGRTQKFSRGFVTPLCFIVCFFEELPDETLSLLSESRPDFLEALDILVSELLSFTAH